MLLGAAAVVDHRRDNTFMSPRRRRWYDTQGLDPFIYVARLFIARSFPNIFYLMIQKRQLCAGDII